MNLIYYLILIVSLIIILLIKTILIIVRKIRQHFIRKQCNYFCFACKYKYECDIFREEGPLI